MDRHYLNVPYREKDEAKGLGARFDWDVKRWYVTPGTDLSLFTRWLPPDEQLAVASGTHAGVDQTAVQPSLHQSGENTSDAVAAAEPAQGIPLSMLLRGVGAAISRQFEEPVWTLVEINEVHLRRHVYLEVSERDEQGQAVARARAIIWASTAERILPAFEKETGTVLAAGVKLLVLIRPRFHEQYGFSLQIEAIDAQYVLGYLEARRREIRSRLQREGVFDANRLLPAPWGFGRVLVVAPQQGAGLGDFRKEAERLQRHGICHFVYAYSRFQGEGAAREVAATIDTTLHEQRAARTPPDVIVLVRGGGATNDLAWLEDYDLLRTVCDLSIPVFVGIGHERDRLLLDEVAHTSFDTPSKVIAGIEQRIQQQVRDAVAAMEEIAAGAGRTLRERHTRLEQLRQQVSWQARETLQTAAHRSRQAYLQVSSLARQEIEMARQHSQRLLTSTHVGAWQQAGQARQTAISQMGLVHERAHNTLRASRQLTESLLREIIGQGPDRTLERGFAIVRDAATSQPVMSAAQARQHPALKLQFKDGTTRVNTQDPSRQ